MLSSHLVSRPTKRIDQLVFGDMVAVEGGGRVRITHSAARDSVTVYPHRRSAAHERVPGWYLIWAVPGEGREVGEIFDPLDEVYLE